MEENKMEMHKMVITPEIAQKMLNERGRNRKIKSTVVDQYSHDMKEGNWSLSPNPISFDEDGRLIDGQHRLAAVVQSNMPIEFWVAINTPRDVPFDLQCRRNTIDNLLYSGLIEEKMGKKQYGSMVNAFLKLRIGGPKFNSLSDYDKGKVLNKYGDEIKMAESISNAGKNHPILKTATAEQSILTAIILNYNIYELYDFCETVNSGLPHGDNPNPALIVRRMIMDKYPMNRRELASVIEQGIVGFTSNKKRKRNYDMDVEPPLTVQISFDQIME